MDFRTTRAVRGGMAYAINKLAWFLATAEEETFRDGTQAVKRAVVACEHTDFKDACYLDTLAAAYAELGEFSAAVYWQRKAVDLSPNDSWLECCHRLELYESGKPYRQCAWV